MHYVADMLQVHIHFEKQQQKKPSSCGTTTKTRYAMEASEKKKKRELPYLAHVQQSSWAEKVAVLVGVENCDE